MDILAINSAIVFGNFTDAELRSISDAVRFARVNLARQVKLKIKVGSTVTFNQGQGVCIRGSVLKIARKYVTVRTGQGVLWRLPADQLTPVENQCTA